MNIEDIKFKLHRDTMLLPRVGKQTTYFVVEDKGTLIDVVAVTDDDKYEYFDNVERCCFKLHPNWAHYTNQEDFPQTHK